MIVLSQEIILACFEKTGRSGQMAISFTMVDDGDAFICIDMTNIVEKNRKVVKGLLKFQADDQSAIEEPLPDGIDVFVVVRVHDFQCKAWVRKREGTEARQVQVVPLRTELYSRTHGLYETDVLKAKTVLIVGLGSGGGLTAVELAKAGVGNFILVDHDRLELANVVRHVCGLSDLGRFKTKAIRDLILDKNPFAQIETYEESCDWEWFSQFQQLVKRADIVFGCTDNRPSRTLINLACILENRICIYGGAFRRAYGGQVLRVIPRQTICYQCFISTLPDKAEDQEISNEAQVESFAYGDEYRPVAIEPGLATDIAPITNLCVKLGILEMLRGTKTTLATLYEDLSSPWFQWLNRREADTDYAVLEPLDRTDGYRILAWYGIPLERDPDCPVCGDYRLSTNGVELSQEKAAALDALFSHLPDSSDRATDRTPN